MPTPILKNAVVTGAGSGVGRAVAIAMVNAGWRVALIGRRKAPLCETAGIAGAKSCLVCPCDLGDESAVQAMAKRVLKAFGTVNAVVNAAGTNVPNRGLAELRMADYHEIIHANMHGAFYCAQAFLPMMRKQRAGTIINIVSEAGKWASPKSGPAYVMSKFGQAGLSAAINAEERRNGIRACAIFPGDISTPLLDKRPEPPTAEARARMLQPEDLADCVMLCLNLPPRAVAEEILLRPA